MSVRAASPRRPVSLPASGPWTALLLTPLLLLACSEDGGPDSVAVGRPDGAVGDAGAGMDAGPPFIRPDDPSWPRTEGMVVLPHDGPTATYSFRIEPELGALDVHMSIDTTSSIGQEIRELQAQLNSVVVAEITDRVPDVAFGVSRFEDFPLPPFGSDGNDSRLPTNRPDSPFLLLTPITKSRSRLNDAIFGLDRPLGFGGDTPESGAEALYQIATGEGYVHGRTEIIEPFFAAGSGAAGDIGGVGFREQTLHVVLHVTDAVMHNPLDYGQAFPNTHGIADATVALEAIGARVIGVVSGCPEEVETCRSDARTQLELLAIATSAHVPPTDDLCATGVDGATRPPVGGTCPLVFDVRDNGRGLSETVVDGIVELVDNLNFGEVQAVSGADPLGFIRSVRAVPPPPAPDPPMLADLLPDGAPDGVFETFVDTSRSTPLEFEVTLHNPVIVPSAVEQRFRIVVRVTGDGLLLEEHGIAVVVPPGVPPAPPAPPEDDAGTP